MGCEVVAFSGSTLKEAEVLSIGASACYTSESLRSAAFGRGLNILIVTTPIMPDWSVYTPLLASKATIFPLTIGPGLLSFPSMPLLLNGITIQGSVVSPRNVHERMLEFAARHSIKPIVQTFAMSREGIQQAFATLKEGNMRYRGVLVVPEKERLAE